MIKCVNKYGALVEEAQDVQERIRQMFKTFVKALPNFTIRELEYLATTEIHTTAAELILLQGVALRQREREMKCQPKRKKKSLKRQKGTTTPPRETPANTATSTTL